MNLGDPAGGALERAQDSVEALEWTQEIRPNHPWKGDILIRRKDVVALLEGKSLAEVREQD